MSKNALVLGATGLTGSLVLEFLLNDPAYDKIIVLGRSTVHKSHPKLEEHIIDMFELEKQQALFQVHSVFCCIGTTKAHTPNKTTYKKIDHGIPVAAAKIAQEQGVEQFLVISALGADPKSRTFYNKVKGEMERDVLQQNIASTYLLRPSLIGGHRNEKRTGERLAQWFMGTFSFLIPEKYKTIEPSTIAKAMLVLANKGYDRPRIENHELKDLVNNES